MCEQQPHKQTVGEMQTQVYTGFVTVQDDRQPATTQIFGGKFPHLKLNLKEAQYLVWDRPQKNKKVHFP